MDYRRLQKIPSFIDRNNFFYILGIAKTPGAFGTHYMCFLNDLQEMFIEIIPAKYVSDLLNNGHCNIDTLIQINNRQEFDAAYSFFYNSGLFDKFSSKVYR